MPTSYLASKPSPNPGLPNWLTWTKDDFFKIDPDSPQVAALVGINSISELVVIYKPVPVIGPDGSFAAILGNLNDEKSEPAFIKIDGSIIGSAYNVVPRSLSMTNSERARHLQMLLEKLPSALSPF